MKSSFPQKKKHLYSSKKIVIFLLFFILLSSAVLAPIRPVKAQMAVTDIPKLIWDKVTETAKKLWQKGGSLAFQQTLRTALNKMAYDTANWVGSGKEGQKPLFVTQGWGDYMTQVGDEAAGTFLENFASNLSNSNSPEQCEREHQTCVDNCKSSDGMVADDASCDTKCMDKWQSCDVKAAKSSSSGLTFNFCQPSSLEAKLKIGLGLSQMQNPGSPNCTASKMIENWGDAAAKYKDFQDPQFLEKMSNILQPESNDLGIYWSASTDMSNKKIQGEAVAKTTLLGKGGWLDPIKIDGKAISLPNQAQLQVEGEYEKYASNFGKYTGDAFVDAANMFLSQLAITSFNTLMQKIGSKNPATADVSSGSGEGDPTTGGGEIPLKAITTKLIQSTFDSGKYDVLSELAVCTDKNNPGPTDCVIDSKFMQAIAEQKTVAEAIQEGYLHGSWRFDLDGQGTNSYSYRNISILRTHRILPVNWELAFEKLNNFQNLANQDPTKYKAKSATLMDMMSCFDPYDDYAEFSAEFDAQDQAWCTGLVDPNWVLKAPLGYCKKEGVSSRILSTNITPAQKASFGNPYIASEVSVVRAENYCADAQTCIRENKNGTCDSYGYCNEEKRTWSFNSDTCEPISNTCQSFIKPTSGQKIAYLENTLDYGTCNQSNAGCKQYSYSGSYDTLNGVAVWNGSRQIYLNQNAKDCSSKDEGCSEFVRIKPTWGANLVMNSDFVNDNVGASSTGAFLNDWPISSTGATQAYIVNSAVEPGGMVGKALKLSVSGGNVQVVSDYNNSLLPDNLELVAGQAYTLSADVYLTTGSKVRAVIGEELTGTFYDTTIAGSWTHISVTRKAGNDFSQPKFSIIAYGNGGQALMYVKNIKFEMADWDTGYTAYSAKKVYQKLLPQYLESACYVGDGSDSNYKLKNDAPAKCSNYAKKCGQNEVGCELYTSTKNKFAIPAKTSSTDYCSSQCLGYDVYVARETYFNSPQAENMIPSTAATCSSEAAGCNEFTNLDDLSSGGENKEYYSALKHCVKPSQATCGSFYAWEGTVSGYQLRLYSLQKEVNGAPSVVSNDSLLCNADIYNAPIDSVNYNPDCQELYGTNGEIFYHLNSRLITCSDSCRAYRITEKNYDVRVAQGACTGPDKNWDTNEGACVVCINGGTWSTTQKACVYQGIPGEGKTCSASENGCREYNGNEGNNVRLAASYNFETPSSIWTSNCTGGISLAPISNNKDGHSLFYNNSVNNCSEIGSQSHNLAKSMPLIKKIMAGDNIAAQLNVGGSVKSGNSYSIKFLASSPRGAEVKFYFYNKDTKEKAEFNGAVPIKIAGGGAWQVYSVNLDNLNHNIIPEEILAITGNDDFYLDNFVLTEITDRYYLMQKTSKIPDICYYDNYHVYQGGDYNLGCTAYADRAGVAHNLRSFSSLCDQASVGCEQVISTQNYSPYGEGIWGDANKNGKCDVDEVDCVKVEGDSALYLVYDQSKQCNSADLGCSMLGQGKQTGGNILWSDVFKKNNPNTYDTIICGADGLGCEEWKNSDNGGLSYFRDPGDNVCVYRNNTIQSNGQKAWYKMAVKRCDANSDGKIAGTEKTAAICASDNTCNGKSCIIDNNDYPCDVSYLETIGFGGDGNRVPVPSKEAGLCDAKFSSCREYIDPVSKFNPDLVSTGTSTIALKRNKLYVLAAAVNATGVASNATLNFIGDVRPFMIDNTFGTTTKNITVGGSVKNAIFNSLENYSVTFAGTKPEVRELVVEYQLSSQLDKGSCNGVVDFANGCILFNERIITGASGYSNLSGAFDSYASPEKSAPVKCDSKVAGSCVANQLIKVRPDRVCAGWLDCVTYAIDPATNSEICYSLKQCNSLDDGGECNNFVASPGTPKFDNATGYSFLGQYNIGNMKEVGLNSEAHYDFEELIPSLSCARITTDADKTCTFDGNVVKYLIIREPDKSKGKADYPSSGKSYLRVPAAYSVSPQAEGAWINLSPNQDYYLNFLLNTKNAGTPAKVMIEVKGVATQKEFTVSSPNGWSRQINKFNSGNGFGGTVQVRIYLRSSDNSKAGEVYFDDINIEPVLQISDNQFVARECRLYPTVGSLSCKNQNKNVIKDGLEGYCLQYDKNNPTVCVTWYPADRVSSSVLGSQSLGYSGPTSLSYCTNVDASVLFAKKAVTKLIFNTQDKNANWVVAGSQTPCSINPSSTDPLLPYDPNCEDHTGTGGLTNVNSDWCGGLVKDYAAQYCGDAVNYNAVLVNDKQSWNNEFVYCVPDEKSPNFLFGVGPWTNAAVALPHASSLENSEGCDTTQFYAAAWFRISGTYSNGTVFVTQPPSRCDDEAAGQCEPINEGTNADPPIRVFDNSHPAVDEQGLQYLSANSGDRDKVFNFTCNNFAQVVSGNGDNKAWAVRTGITSDPKWAFNTPPFFENTPGVGVGNLKLYGRQRNGVPFGASVFDEEYDLLNSGPVYLQNQYYIKDKAIVFGGRPYDCSGTSCMNVGYCSDNPNVMCLFLPKNYKATCSTPSSCVITYSIGDNDAEYVNKKTCSDGGFGVCRPLWNSTNSFSASGVLKNIFLQSYGTFKYSAGAYIPDSQGWNVPGQVSVPTVTNPVLKLSGQNTGMQVKSSGIYSLEFNTTVDPEQQPLKMIYIDWGDGGVLPNAQAITGQDHKPDTNNPHVFYHYYDKAYGAMSAKIKIKIWDNWDNTSN